jgi:hypothetical protein
VILTDGKTAQAPVVKKAEEPKAIEANVKVDKSSKENEKRKETK